MNWGLPIERLFPYLSPGDLALTLKWTAMLVEGFCPSCSSGLIPVEETLEGDVVRAFCSGCPRDWWMRNDPETGAEFGWQLREPHGGPGGSFRVRSAKRNPQHDREEGGR